MLVLYLLCGFNNINKLVSDQAGATDEKTIDLRNSQLAASIRRVDATAV